MTEGPLWNGQKKNIGDGGLIQFHSRETSPISLEAAPDINAFIIENIRNPKQKGNMVEIGQQFRKITIMLI